MVQLSALKAALEANQATTVYDLVIGGARLENVNDILSAFTNGKWSALIALATYSTDQLTLNIILYWAVMHDADREQRSELARIAILRGASMDEVVKTIQ